MKLFIVIDVQNDFVTGSLGTSEAKLIIPNVKKAILNARRKGYEIIYTRDTHDDDYLETFEGKKLPIEHCIYCTEGWEIVRDIDIPESLHINKYSFGVCDWMKQLKSIVHYFDIEEIMICGLVSDICVITNALNLRTTFPDTPISVIKDCCAGTTPEAHEAAMKIMESCQIDII